MFESLSPTQREIVFDKSGKFIVRACPGSGKTYCVSARLAKLIGEWKEVYSGIAALSFTNVAWQEIEKICKEEFLLGKPISFPHFLGTLDSFINQFIFLPFGHLVMKCEKRPTLVGEPHGSWSWKNFDRDAKQYFDKCTFNANGELIRLAHPQIFCFSWKRNRNGDINGNVKNLLAVKNTFVALGYANQSDANYFAMRVLEQYPLIRRALALRFPTLIIDETQDTSEIQMQIIDLLIYGGLNEIMLVGDPDQAIFEWHDAKPALLENKIIEWKNVVRLNENRRSSQCICDFTYKLSSLETPSISVNDNVANCNIKPMIVTYDNNLKDVINSFLDICTQNQIQISADTVAVLYRSKGMINEITGVQRIPFGIDHWDNKNSFTQDFVKGKFFYDNGDFKKGGKLIEKAIIKMTNNVPACSEETLGKCIEKIGFIKHRTMVHNFIGILPQTDTSLGNWIALANAAFNKNKIQHLLQVNPQSNNFTISQIFLNEDEYVTETNYRIGTVHSVKGESFDAILLILKDIAGNRRKYVDILSEARSPSDHEELRIVYVGMTRPRKVLMLAVPNAESKKAWENKLCPAQTSH